MFKGHFPKYPQRGKLGYYGVFTLQDRNDKRQLVNVLVDKHNQLINTFKTKKENDDFYHGSEIQRYIFINRYKDKKICVWIKTF